MELPFKGKRAVVTGASQGIGRHIAQELSKAGARVYALARNQAALETLRCDGIEVIAVDLSDWTATKKALERIGDVDLLVNNAAVAKLAPILTISEEDIDESFELNVKALINVTQHVAQNLIGRGASGSIVNVSSQASLAGLLEHGVYCATKGAVDAFSRVAAAELGPRGIRVNCVNPTVIMTDMGKLGWSEPVKRQAMLDKLPLGRFGEVREVTDAVLFLLSDKASLITGTCLPVDAGFLAV